MSRSRAHCDVAPMIRGRERNSSSSWCPMVQKKTRTSLLLEIRFAYLGFNGDFVAPVFTGCNDHGDSSLLEQFLLPGDLATHIHLYRERAHSHSPYFPFCDGLTTTTTTCTTCTTTRRNGRKQCQGLFAELRAGPASFFVCVARFMPMTSTICCKTQK